MTLEVGPLGWAVLIALVAGLLALDLVLGSVRPHVIGLKEAAVWSTFYVAVAIAFGVVFASRVGWEYGGQYFAGYARAAWAARSSRFRSRTRLKC